MRRHDGPEWKCLAMLAVVLLCAVVTEGAIIAGHDNASWDDSTYAGWAVVPGTSTSVFYYVDGDDKVQKWEPKTFRANATYVDTHVMTDEGNHITHYHFQYDYDGAGGRPSKTQVNVFWDERLGADLDYVSRHSDATVRTNCHTWAFDWKADAHGEVTPSYNQWFDDPSTAYTDDCGAPRGVKSVDLVQYDFLRYGTTDHTAIVLDVYRNPCTDENAPWSYRSKCQGGGVYDYIMPIGQDWDFPRRVGAVVVGKTLAQQAWTLDPDFLQNPNVYPDDNDE